MTQNKHKDPTVVFIFRFFKLLFLHVTVKRNVLTILYINGEHLRR